jgi:hypothetical protein
VLAYAPAGWDAWVLGVTANGVDTRLL